MRTPDYDIALKATQEFHTKQKGFNGRFLLRYVDDVSLIVKEFHCHSLLDYGCGRGAQYEGTHEFEPGKPETLLHYLWIDEDQLTRYDPGYPPFAADPVGKFDLVICTQVLGSIPITDLGWVVERICGYATKAVYFAESLVEAPRKQLHRNLRGKMPHGWTREQWSEVIAAGSRKFPTLPVFLRTKGKSIQRGERVLAVFHAGEGSHYHVS